jgi:hypothetical protein
VLGQDHTVLNLERRIVAELGLDADPFMLHLYAALAQKERALFSARTRDALREAKAAASCSAIPGSPTCVTKRSLAPRAGPIASPGTSRRSSERFSRAGLHAPVGISVEIAP